MSTTYVPPVIGNLLKILGGCLDYTINANFEKVFSFTFAEPILEGHIHTQTHEFPMTIQHGPE